MIAKKHVAYQIEAIYLDNPVVIPTIVKETSDLLSTHNQSCLLYTSPSPRDGLLSRMPSSA